jgi:hypothetical protein
LEQTDYQTTCHHISNFHSSFVRSFSLSTRALWPRKL